MERLTEKRDGQNVIPLRQNGKVKWSICSAGLGDAPTEYLYGEHADRLAAYEDTGLEPEEIISAVDMEKVACALHELNAYKELGPIDRLHELAEADREGRCVVLPKDGMVYYIEEAGGEKWIGNKPIQQVILRCGFGMALLEFSLFDKGKYFSRAEAEAALRREQE